MLNFSWTLTFQAISRQETFHILHNSQNHLHLILLNTGANDSPKKCRGKEYTLLLDRKSLSLLDSYIIEMDRLACMEGKTWC